MKTGRGCFGQQMWGGRLSIVVLTFLLLLPVVQGGSGGRRLQTASQSCPISGLIPISGLSGSTAAYGFNQTSWANIPINSTCPTGDYLDDYSAIIATVSPGTKSIVYQLDAGQTLTEGYALNIDTCPSFPSGTLNTTIFIGTSCPLANASLGTNAWTSFNCLQGALTGSAVCPGSYSKPGLSAISDFYIFSETAARFYYIVVTIPASFPFTAGQGIRLNWTITAPSPTPSAQPTPTLTPTATPVAFDCFSDPNVGPSFAFWLNGTSGVVSGYTGDESRNWAVDPSNWGAGGPGGDYSYNGGYYSGGDYSSTPPQCIEQYFPDSGAQLIAIDLRAAAAAADDRGEVFPWGGFLTVDTCGSGFDTILFAGIGCPTDSGNYQCVDDSDNSNECPYVPFASPSPSAGASGSSSPAVTRTASATASALQSPSGTASLSPWASFQSLVRIQLTADTPIAFIIVTGTGDQPTGNYTLRWSYAPPGSATPSPSGSPSASASASPSPSVTPTSSLSSGECAVTLNKKHLYLV